MTGEQITLDEVVSSARMALRIPTSDSDIFLMDMCNEGVRHLDALSVFKKQICVLEVDTQAQTAKLPCGFKRLLGLRFGTGNGCEDLIYVDLPYLKSCDCTVTNSAADFRGVFEISNGTIFFHNLPSTAPTDDSSVPPAPITSVTLGYMGLNVDEKGRGIIYEDYRRALRAYICWKYCLQNNDEVLYRNQVSSYYAEWVNQKKWIKSIDQQEAFHNQRHQIRSIMNSWISDKKNWATT